MKKLNKKTKILAVGDIHGDTGFVKRIAERAERENVDLIIIAGDLTFAESSTKNLVGPFMKTNKPVLIIPGNHENVSTIDFLEKMYFGTKNIHGYSVKHNNLGIFGAGGGNVINFTPDKKIFELLEKGHSYIKDVEKKIMVTHMHPSGSEAEFSGFAGSNSVARAIKEFRPDILISAHIHEAGGIEEKIGKTKVINVSRKEMVFEI